MNRLSMLKRTAAEARAAGRQDSRHFLALYRAYLHGASEAAGDYYESEREHSFRMAVAAMAFALLSWLVTMYFVFR